METTLPNPAPRILLVEDEDEVARLVLRTLSDFGYAAEWLRTGGALLAAAAAEPPTLAIVDLGLPDIDGMELVRCLRQEHGCGVLILTGRGYTADRVMGLELGADDYIVKPFEPRELIARMRSILRRCEAVREPAGAEVQMERRFAHFAGWCLDTATLLLTAPDGVESTLSAAEAALLCVFLDKPNRILNRDQLLGEREVAPFDRSIDVRISRLRRKIEADPHNPKIIRTVYGAGYLFGASVVWA